LAAIAEDSLSMPNGLLRNLEDKENWGKGRWEIKPSVLFLAPTHKAARQIEKSMRSRNVELDVRTIASALALRPVRRGDKEVYLPDYDAELIIGDETNLVIIDELSMVSQELLDLLEAKMFKHTALVGVGDEAQLPPVGEAQTCSLFRVNTRIELTEVVRHAGPILELATQTRLLGAGRPRFASSSANGSSIVNHRDRGAWGRAAIEACAEAEGERDFDRARVLCFLNRSAASANAAIHARIYGANAAPFNEGQPIITHGPVTPPPAFPGEASGLPLVNGSTELEIVSEPYMLERSIAGDEIVGVMQAWKYWKIEAMVLGEYGNTFAFETIDPSEQGRWAQAQATLSKMAKAENDQELKAYFWRHFWYRQDQFATVTSIWAMTVHKSQGSTFGSVFLHYDTDWNKDKEYVCKLVYVGLTRASRELHVAGF
jgi:exodeoxyribonuclease-5